MRRRKIILNRMLKKAKLLSEELEQRHVQVTEFKEKKNFTQLHLRCLQNA